MRDLMSIFSDPKQEACILMTKQELIGKYFSCHLILISKRFTYMLSDSNMWRKSFIFPDTFVGSQMRWQYIIVSVLFIDYFILKSIFCYRAG
jgi:hypothetical protein